MRSRSASPTERCSIRSAAYRTSPAAELRTVSPVSFREDPLRILRGLRFVSQLGFDLSEDAEVQMRLEAPGLATVSAERIGGGITGDGLGELSKLLLGHEPARALLLGRDTGVILHVLPELAPCVGYRLPAGRNPLPLEEHLFAVVQVAADAGTSLDVRLAALLHDMGKPEADATGAHHAGVGARIAGGVLRRLRYPTRTQATVTEIVRGHGFALDGPIDALPRAAVSRGPWGRPGVRAPRPQGRRSRDEARPAGGESCTGNIARAARGRAPQPSPVA